MIYRFGNWAIDLSKIVAISGVTAGAGETRDDGYWISYFVEVYHADGGVFKITDEFVHINEYIGKIRDFTNKVEKLIAAWEQFKVPTVLPSVARFRITPKAQQAIDLLQRSLQAADPLNADHVINDLKAQVKELKNHL